MFDESRCIISLAWTHSCQRSATFAAHPPCRVARFRANGSHPRRPADAEHARLLGMVLHVVIVLVGWHSLGAAGAVAVVRQANLVLLVECKSLLDKV